MRPFAKSILRIAVFSIGGLLATVGLMAILGTLIQSSGFNGELVIGIAIGLVLSGAGTGICFLAPRLPKPAKDRKTMSREERIIADLTTQMERRKQHIVVLAFLTVLSLAIAGWTAYQGSALDATMAPDRIKATIFAETAERGWPLLFSSLYTIAGYKAKLVFYTFWFALQTGFLIALLIIEAAKRTEREDRLALWQKLQRFENEIAELKSGAGRNT